LSGAYKDAGVDTLAGAAAAELIKPLARATFTGGVLSGPGGFGGLFEPDLSGLERPVLVCGTDGVGTKLQYAFLSDRHDTVGIDCVAMCANDVLCCGARPLLFLDYIVCEKVVPEQIAAVVAGVAEGCRRAGCALLGGETAEHPGCFPAGEYDLAGFCAGIVNKRDIIDGSSIAPGDVIAGLPSSGPHSNGYSLLRKLFPRPGAELLELLLTPTKIYVNDVFALVETVTVKGLAHITGGGWLENIPRMLPPGLRAAMYKPRSVPGVFAAAQKQGGLDTRDMFGTFNMGVGMAVCLSPADAERSGYPVIGRVEEGGGGIVLW
jgi:phosphoribosylformylglycinamidine cyclo-ligase